ncbi:hypothetical protein FALBO_5153 [Fusarium albosuccineum]|uniref:Uncharacterized protein n=1 Tax=Fusarium albosuccineum TaxID=1237068 RepID=A0A8H4PEJ0_9HYPO|nr:hypothetical protein FALBO_5153 [Fusarium albosuccineum]
MMARNSGCSRVFGFWDIWDRVRYLSQAKPRDKCSFLKAHVKKCEEAESSYRHDFFHHTLTGQATTSQISEIGIQIVQFLTFEALEMAHTCCNSAELSHEQVSDVSLDGPPVTVLLAYDSGKARRIRSDEHEQKKARQLELLMQEFVQEMQTLGPSPRAFEVFIWGYWRHRISTLYTVDPAFIDKMRQTVESVETHVLPERLRSFLDDSFQLVKEQRQELPESRCSETTQDGDMVPVEEIVGLGSCFHCNRTARAIFN